MKRFIEKRTDGTIWLIETGQEEKVEQGYSSGYYEKRVWQSQERLTEDDLNSEDLAGIQINDLTAKVEAPVPPAETKKKGKK